MATEALKQPAATTTTEQAAITEEKLSDLLEKVLVKTEKKRGEIALSERGVEFGNFEGLIRWANLILDSGFHPKGVDSVQKITVAIVLGRAVGLDPFQAVQNIAVINGRPTLWGDVPLAIARQHPGWDESGFKEWIEGEGENMRAVCQTLRKGSKEPHESSFSVADARTAKLWGKEGPWTFYPKRMLMFRARGYNLRDNFGDALKGLQIKEIVDHEEETPNEPPVGTINLRPEKKETKAPTNGTAAPKGETKAADEPKKEAPKETERKPETVQRPTQQQMAIQDVMDDLKAQIEKAMDRTDMLQVGEAEKKMHLSEEDHELFMTWFQAKFNKLQAAEKQPVKSRTNF